MRSNLQQAARLVLGATLAAATSLAMAQAQTVPAPTMIGSSAIVEVPAGIWVISSAGRVSYCNNNSNASGAPLSKCAVIGTIGAAPASFVFNFMGSGALYAVNKTSGTIQTCTLTLMISGASVTPQGGCMQVSTLANLQ